MAVQLPLDNETAQWYPIRMNFRNSPEWVYSTDGMQVTREQATRAIKRVLSDVAGKELKARLSHGTGWRYEFFADK